MAKVGRRRDAAAPPSLLWLRSLTAGKTLDGEIPGRPREASYTSSAKPTTSRQVGPRYPGGVALPVHAHGMAAGPATLAIRPQRLVLGDPGPGIPGSVKRVAYLGSRVEYVVATAWGELLIFDVDVHRLRRRDEAVAVTFAPDAAIVLPR